MSRQVPFASSQLCLTCLQQLKLSAQLLHRCLCLSLPLLPLLLLMLLPLLLTLPLILMLMLLSLLLLLSRLPRQGQARLRALHG